jgi:hypothetical protein
MRDAYGVKTVAIEDRLRWFEDVTSLFNKPEASWSACTLFGDMGIAMSYKSGPPDPQIVSALGLKAQ